MQPFQAKHEKEQRQNLLDQAQEIISKTNDGEDLAPEHLKLVEVAVNGWLSESGEVEFQKLYRAVINGYSKPWFHGIEHLTIGHEGYVYWKGVVIEHYDIPWAYSEKARKQALELKRRCLILETQNKKVDYSSVIWGWEGPRL